MNIHAIHILIIIVSAFAISVVLTEIEIPFLRRKAGQNIREEGLKSHYSKAGTPSMGGISIIFATCAMALIGTLAFGGTIGDELLILLVFVGYGMIGFVDDYRKVIKKQNEELSKKFKVEGVPTAIILSADGQKALWSNVGYTPLFLEQLQKGVQGLDKDYPETAKAVKDEAEAAAKAKAEEKAAKEKAEREAFEKQQKELEDAWDQYASPPFVDPAELNRNANTPWGAGRINRNIQPDPELLRELDKNGPIKGPDVLPNGGPAPLRNHVKRD